MNFLIFLNNDTYSATALSLLAPTLNPHNTKIILSQKVGNINNLPQELIALKQREKCEFDWQKFGFEVLSYDNVNSEKALQDFREFSPDLIISIRFGQIFKSALIGIPRLGVLNLHSGILPKYRGILASFWTILNGDKKLGMTLHYITDQGIDTGEIIGFTEMEIDWNSSLFSNINKLYEGGSTLLLETIEKIIKNKKVSTTPQSKFGEGQYFSYPKSEDVQKFLKIMPLF